MMGHDIAYWAIDTRVRAEAEALAARIEPLVGPLKTAVTPVDFRVPGVAELYLSSAHFEQSFSKSTLDGLIADIRKAAQ